MSSSDPRRAPARPVPPPGADPARGHRDGFTPTDPPAARRGGHLLPGLLLAAVMAGSLTAGAHYGPWLQPAGDEALAADARPTTTAVPAPALAAAPPLASTTTVPESTTVAPTTTETPPATTAPPATAATRVAPAGPATTRAKSAPAARVAAAPVAPPGSGWQGEMLASVNASRAQAGLAPLVACGALNRAAQNYADTMAASGVLSHTGPDGSTLTSRVRAAGYNMAPGARSVSYAENIAQGQPSVAAVMAGWMNSPGHRANLLAPGTTHIGVGRHGVWWVQNFGAGGTC
jgi:uncharacterized protein YkwD